MNSYTEQTSSFFNWGRCGSKLTGVEPGVLWPNGIWWPRCLSGFNTSASWTSPDARLFKCPLLLSSSTNQTPCGCNEEVDICGNLERIGGSPKLWFRTSWPCFIIRSLLFMSASDSKELKSRLIGAPSKLGSKIWLETIRRNNILPYFFISCFQSQNKNKLNEVHTLRRHEESRRCWANNILNS